MLHDAGIAPCAPACSAARMSVSRPFSTLNVSRGVCRMISMVFCKSPDESLMPTMFGTSASFATVSGSMLSPPHVAGLLYSTTGSDVLSATRRKWSNSSL